MYEQEKIELFGQKVSLARDMIQDKILPYNWVYDNVFNFSDKEKVDIEKQIIDDQKQKFRHSQIEMEGNDPMDTGESIGTPSDMAVGIGQDDVPNTTGYQKEVLSLTRLMMERTTDQKTNKVVVHKK